MNLKSKIKQEVKRQFNDIVGMRRHLHMYPELSFQEKLTSAYIKDQLEANGIKYKSGYCKYGIVAEVKGRTKGKTIYLRGDMDALPIHEIRGRDYGSRHDGVMHACGHDVHTTCVLSAAIILNRLKDEIAGTVRFLFQPGEEKLPGGASIMIKEGAISNKGGTVILGQHVHPPLESGKVGFHAGEYMASADELYIDIIGKGGHAALPQDCIDPVLASASVIQALHTVVSRYSNPLIPAVLSIGKINSEGGATNVIPNKVHMQGTLRTMDEDNRAAMHNQIKKIVKNTAAAYGAKARTLIKKGYPTLKNDPDLVHECVSFAQEYLGKNNVVMLPKRMTAEDFAYYSQMMPSCFYRLGTGNTEKGITSPVHTADFDIDEKALSVGVGLMAYMAVRKLQQ